MKPITPRKTRRRNQTPSNAQAGPSHAIPISDYESDALDPQITEAFASSATAVESSVQAVQSTQGTDPIRAMNLLVLRRFHPSIRDCIPGPPTTIYVWDHEISNWGEAQGPGTPFVCDQDPDMNTPFMPRSCLFILNRKKNENFFFDLSTVIGLQQVLHEIPEIGTKLMIQLTLRNPDGSGIEPLWSLVGDVDPMKVLYDAMQDKINQQNAARSQLQ